MASFAVTVAAVDAAFWRQFPKLVKLKKAKYSRLTECLSESINGNQQKNEKKRKRDRDRDGNEASLFSLCFLLACKSNQSEVLFCKFALMKECIGKSKKGNKKKHKLDFLQLLTLMPIVSFTKNKVKKFKQLLF